MLESINPRTLDPLGGAGCSSYMFTVRRNDAWMQQLHVTRVASIFLADMLSTSP